MVSMATTTTALDTEFLLGRRTSQVSLLATAIAPSEELAPIRERPGSLQQTADTLHILLDRVRALEAASDSARAIIADLELAVAAAVDELARERNVRAGAMDELLRSLLLLVDSVSVSVTSDTRTRLEEGLRSVRADVERGRATVRAQTDSIARALGNLRVRLDEREAEFTDSLATAAGRIEEERQRRQSGDERSGLLMSLAAGLLLVAVGGVWWHGARGVEEVGRKFVAKSEHRQHQSLREHLRALEELSMMLGTIRTAVENADEHRDPELNHDLPLKVCNEINRIEKNLRAMDASVKGHKKLVGCVRRVKNNLSAHGYQMTELVGRPYDGGMLLEADFVVDEQMGAGEKVIVQVNRPEIRFGGDTIQTAAVRVSVARL